MERTRLTPLFVRDAWHACTPARWTQSPARNTRTANGTVQAPPTAPLLHANLFPGEENSGKLVTQIKSEARDLGKSAHADLMLIDGPPGIGCPVTAACNGVDLAVIVSEPTLTGFHDLRRVKAVADHFRIPTLLVINKCGLNDAIQQEMLDYAETEKMATVGLIPYDEEIMHAQALARPITQTLQAHYRALISGIWAQIRHAAGL